MGQGVTQNYTEGATPYFEDSNKNIDVHFKIGRYLFKGKATVGFGINFRTINDSKFTRGEDFDPETDYIERTEFQLGFFSRYKIYDKLFIEGYAGFFGWVFDGGIFPGGTFGPIIKYKVGVGYAFDIWHFLAIEPNISLINRRNLFRGSEFPKDDVGIVSYGLGLAFKL